METKDYAAIAQQYARDVVSGRQPACKWIRLQCERFLDELKQQRRKEFPFRFEPRKAARFCAFIECLPHIKGPNARARESIVLEPWQVWIFANVFGWLRKSNGTRRYRRLFLVVPRKNGKSIIASGAGLYMFCMDGEPGAEVYAGCTSENKAKLAFEPAQKMVQRLPQLQSALGIEVLAKAMVRHADGSKFETIISNPGDGQSPSCSIHDEYHEHDDDRQVESMWLGMGAREQALQIIITTAGYNLGGPCYALILEERDKLLGVGCEGGVFPVDHETFFVEYTVDEEDDWKSEIALRKANPNMGVSVAEDWLLARRRDAIRNHRDAPGYKTKNLNLWVAAKTAYFDIEAWRRCRDERVPLIGRDLFKVEHFRGRRAVLGLDLATKIDIAALEVLLLPIGEKATRDDPYIRVGRYFLPAETVEKRPSYQTWDAGDLLDVTDGEVTDFERIEDELRALARFLIIESVAYDPWNGAPLAQRMMAEGLPMLEYRQTVANMSLAMKELDAISRSGVIAWSGCPVMEWQLNNVVAKLDANDNVFPRKLVPEAKIDNPVALIMALGASMVGEAETQSFWEVMNT